MSAPSSAPEPARHWLEACCRPAAVLVPLVITILRASPSSQWRDDVALVRGLALVAVGVEGTISSLLTSLLSLLPLGGRGLRAAWLSAIALSIAAHFAYLLTRRVLESYANTPRLTPPLALAAALTATLAPAWQLEGTLAGGAPLSAMLVLGALWVSFRTELEDARYSAAAGLICGVLLCESHAAAIALVLAVGARAVVLSSLPSATRVMWFLLGAAASLLLGVIFFLIRPLAPGVALSLDAGFESSSLALLDAARVRTTSLGAWLGDVGVISFALALSGLVLGVVHSAARRTLVPLLVFVLADMVFAAKEVTLLAPDPFACVRLLALVTLGISASLSVQAATLALGRARIPFAEPASVLLVVFTLTLVFVSAEDSRYVASRKAQVGAELWTDEALAGLPPDSLILTRSRAIAYRIWATQTVRGERSDVMVLPESLLERGQVSARLLAMEPALMPLIREVALSGRADEFSLSSLADTRPLFVELDPTWKPRLLEHLLPRGFFLEFAAQPLGRSDRKASAKRGFRGLSRVSSALEGPPFRDQATASVLMARFRERALTLAVLGDREAALEVSNVLHTLDPEDELAAALKAELAEKHGEKLDLSRLLNHDS